MDATYTLLASLALLIPCLYMYTASVVHMRFPSLVNKRICVLIAHPDDEAMFFAPTVQALTRPETGNHVKLLCLSTGTPPPDCRLRLLTIQVTPLGWGPRASRNSSRAHSSSVSAPKKMSLSLTIRTTTPTSLCGVFANKSASAQFPDSMSANWDSAAIASLLTSAFAPRRSDKPAANIDVLITFDGAGVSSHPNHISLYHGARAFVASLTRGKAGWASPVALYSLTSVPVVRKYTSILDMFPTMVVSFFRVGSQKGKTPASLVFMNQLAGDAALPAAWGAMTTAHKSQMVWFRYLWISFSRYMVINDLRLEKVT